MPWARRLPFLVLFLTCTAGSLPAQVGVVGVRDLAFGSVIPGIATNVSPSDPVQSGMWEVTAQQGDRVQVRLTLPKDLTAPGGFQMPVGYANNHAIAVSDAPGATPAVFNPNAAQNFRLQSSGRFFVFLGGTVSPTATQQAGNYSATAVLTITVF